jgi:hypothetical protein
MQIPEGHRTRGLGLSALEEDAEVLVEQHVGVEHDRAHRHFSRAVYLSQYFLAATEEKLMIRHPWWGAAVGHPRTAGRESS